MPRLNPQDQISYRNEEIRINQLKNMKKLQNTERVGSKIENEYSG